MHLAVLAIRGVARFVFKPTFLNCVPCGMRCILRLSGNARMFDSVRRTGPEAGGKEGPLTQKPRYDAKIDAYLHQTLSGVKYENHCHD